MKRITAFQEKLKEEESFLVSNPANIRYLSGFTGSNGLLVISKTKAKLFTDFRYSIQAQNEVTDFELTFAADIWAKMHQEIDARTLLIEAEHLTHARFFRLKNLLVGSNIEGKEKFIESMREEKDAGEISKIRRACEISTTALQRLIELPLIGKSEKIIATTLERLMIDLGAEKLAFETIVASGPNSAIPHHQPTERTLEHGDFLKIDFGAMVDGYRSDCTRTFVAGVANEWHKSVHQAVKLAQGIGRAEVQIGRTTKEIDSKVRESLAKANYLEYFIHGLGHGVGIDIHEDPFLGLTTQGSIAKNMVITIEPGLYFPDRGGVRIEDTGVVTDSGYEVLTVFTYDLIELN